MGWFEVCFIFVVSWWMLLFILLPIKAGAAAEQASGHEYYSAPPKAYLKQKLLGATLLAALLTGLLAYLIHNGTIALWLPYRF
jgi:predicted secreted protein